MDVKGFEEDASRLCVKYLTNKKVKNAVYFTMAGWWSMITPKQRDIRRMYKLDYVRMCVSSSSARELFDY